MGYFDDIIDEIIDGKVKSPDDLQKAKIRLCREYSRDKLPKNAEILERVDERDDVSRDDVLHVLQRKPMRTKSGVAVIAVMTSPAECPHGRCKMCPGGPRDKEPSPQSYTGEEPAALRGARNEYSPEEQVRDRLEQYDAIGHTTDKIDMIVMGGTFPSRDWSYQKDFVKGCLDALNDEESSTLKEAQKINETSEKRCIGLTIETRPDYCKEKELERMLTLGATRVEIGVQSTKDRLLKNINRGHSVKDSVEATRLAKKKGLKVCYHMMPGLPGSSREEDLEDFRNLFKDDRFKPDMLKIYPTLVVKGTELYDMWKEEEYEPYSTEEAAELIAEIKASVPRYVRIQRVQRDIPSPLVDGGVKKSNLRQYARKELERKGLTCDCIRCREVGHSKKEIDLREAEINTTTYNASEGTEHFLEIGSSDIIAGYARLRVEPEAMPTIRELKVVGSMTPVEEEGEDYQHSGLGKRLLKRCEELASEEDKKVRVTSGIGAREYYRKNGYRSKGHYMVKSL